ncbi:MAG: hypothetical protein IKD46_02740 [Lentisphaeria bacterium]|nr:hypothetical protein [Lentisphaeria bacterium]
MVHFAGKALVLCGLLVCGVQLFALRAGDPATELKADFVFHGPVALTGAAEAADREKVKVLVFFRTQEESSRELMNHLFDLKVRYPFTEIVALTPDSKRQAQAFFDVYSHRNFSGAADIDLQTCKAYLTANSVYPYVFLIGSGGMILWDGEAADLADALERFAGKTLDPAKQREISPLLAELRSRFRNGEERMANFAAGRIFEIDPANSEAIRLRLFMLQGAGRYRDAWELLEDRRKAVPGNGKLYFQQIELACRIPAYDAQAVPVAQAYLRNVPAEPGGDGAMAWLLMERRPFDAAALQTAGQLIGRSMALLEARPGKTVLMADADLYSAAALYSYRLGNLEAAELMQKKASAVLEKTALHRLGFSRGMESFYQSVRNMTGKK